MIFSRMTRKYRQFIFWIFVILFIIASIIITLFAQGWRFNFESLRIVKTGGIFIKTTVSGAKIYVNDGYTGSTGGILNYTKLINNLTPKNYNLFIYKEGYYPWNKLVQIKDGLVTELVHINLLPLELKRVVVAELPIQNIAEFRVKDETIKIITNKKTGSAIFYNFDGKLTPNKSFETATSTELISPDKNKKLRVLNNQILIDYINDVKEEPAKTAGEKEIIATSESPILFFDWFKDSEHIIWFADNELTIAERDNRGGKRNVITYYINITPPIFWDSKESDLYFFENSTEKSVLYKINIE